MTRLNRPSLRSEVKSINQTGRHDKSDGTISPQCAGTRPGFGQAAFTYRLWLERQVSASGNKRSVKWAGKL